MWSFMKNLCCTIGVNSCTNPYSFNIDWCNMINDEEINHSSRQLSSSFINKSTEIRTRACMNSADVSELVNYFIKCALNGASVSIYDQMSQSFISGKYFINRSLNILTIKSPMHTIIIPFKAVS